MKIHRVKRYDRFFRLTESGEKLFEVRRNDRDYQVGDLLELNETTDAEHTGRAALFRIAVVLTSEMFPEGIKDGYAVLGVKPVTGVYEDYGKEQNNG